MVFCDAVTGVPVMPDRGAVFWGDCHRRPRDRGCALGCSHRRAGHAGAALGSRSLVRGQAAPLEGPDGGCPPGGGHDNTLVCIAVGAGGVFVRVVEMAPSAFNLCHVDSSSCFMQPFARRGSYCPPSERLISSIDHRHMVHRRPVRDTVRVADSERLQVGKRRKGGKVRQVPDMKL